MGEEHRRMIAEGMATLHRFAAEPNFKHGKPQLQRRQYRRRHRSRQDQGWTLNPISARLRGRGGKGDRHGEVQDGKLFKAAA
jgi:hypothetical protein